MDCASVGWFSRSSLRSLMDKTISTERVYSSSIRPKIFLRTSADSTSDAYWRAIPSSVLASETSALSSKVRKNGQRRYILRSCSRPSGVCAAKSFNAEPTPYQAEIRCRDCVHENTHGIARNCRMSAVAARRDGREPSRRCSMRSIGVACQKYSENSGVS